MRKTLCIVFVVSCFGNVHAQYRFSFGLATGATVSKPEQSQKDDFGELTAGYGFNVYLPVMYNLGYSASGKRFRSYYIESGLGYYCNSYSFRYGGSINGSRNCHPYIPLKFRIEKLITHSIALVSGIGAVVDFFPINLIHTSTDSLSKTTCITNLPGKMNSYISMELGIQKYGKSGSAHQFNMQLFYGLQTVATGTGYHFNNPGLSTTYTYKGSFISVNYCFLFRGHSSPPNSAFK